MTQGRLNNSYKNVNKHLQHLKDFYDICSKENFSLIKFGMERAQQEAQKQDIEKRKNKLRSEKYRQKLIKLYLDRYF